MLEKLLFECAKRNDVDKFKKLLARFCEPANELQDNKLQVTDLINTRNQDKDTLLYIAIQNGNNDFVDLLIQYGADVNATVKFDNRSPLHVAAKNSNFKSVQMLIQAGANVNATMKQDHTPLTIAAVHDNSGEIVELLINAGADVNAVNWEQYAPLLLAMENPCSRVAELLIAAKSDVNKRSIHGDTPIHGAVFTNRANLLKLLIKAGSNLENRRGENKETVLHTAVHKQLPEITEILLKNGARVQYAMPSGFTPIQRAFDKDNKKIIGLLLEYGGGLFATISKPLKCSINFDNKIVIEFKLEGKPVTRNTPGFEKAITNVAEFKKAILQGVKFNKKALEASCNQLLAKIPNNKVLKKFKAALWVLPASSLINLCLNTLNKPNAYPYRKICFNEGTIIPEHLTNELNPEQNENPDSILNIIKPNFLNGLVSKLFMGK